MSSKKRVFNDFSQFVYSTNPEYKAPDDEAGDRETSEPEKQVLEVHFERKHRGGKPGTLIKGFRGSAEALNDLARFLKSKLATGGTAKNGEIFIQGLFRDRIMELLKEKGYQVKRVGG